VPPGPDWTVPFAHLLKPWQWDFVQARITPLRPSQLADDNTSVRAVNALANGGRVLGIGHDPDRLLPSSMRTGADMVVRLPQPSGEVVGAVIKRMYGRERLYPGHLVRAALVLRSEHPRDAHLPMSSLRRKVGLRQDMGYRVLRALPWDG